MNQHECQTIAYLERVPITTEQFALLVEHGHFVGEKVIHFAGEIVKVNPKGPLHCHVIDKLVDWAHKQNDLRVRQEQPLVLTDHHSTPEPDLSLVVSKNYSTQHPAATDALLVVEVTVTTTRKDNLLRAAYAKSGIAEFWQVLAEDQVVFRFTNPKGDEYTSSARYTDQITFGSFEPLVIKTLFE